MLHNDHPTGTIPIKEPTQKQKTTKTAQLKHKIRTYGKDKRIACLTLRPNRPSGSTHLTSTLSDTLFALRHVNNLFLFTSKA